jgi:hypothetical protein
MSNVLEKMYHASVDFVNGNCFQEFQRQLNNGTWKKTAFKTAALAVAALLVASVTSALAGGLLATFAWIAVPVVAIGAFAYCTSERAHHTTTANLYDQFKRAF